MTNLEKIKQFYESDNFRNSKFVEELFDDEIVLEWNSSVGAFNYSKEDILKLSKELFENYVNSKVEIKTIFGDENSIAVRYDYYASTIENPNELHLITKIMVIWEFKNGKIINGYQTSVLG